MEKIAKNPIKYILRGFLKKLEWYPNRRSVELKVQRGSETEIDIYFLDGYLLDQLDVCARLKTREDVKELIYFLNVHEMCLPYKNGTLVPDAKPIK